MGLIASGAHPVEDGKLAVVVTTLDSRGAPSGVNAPPGTTLEPWELPTVGDYRALFRLVGSPWLWFSRLTMDDLSLNAIVSDPLVRVLRVCVEGEVVGFVELDGREPGVCEVQFVGLVPEWTGRGLGRWLLAETLRLAWGSRVERVRVRTCTLDHPAALPSYRKAGFVAVAREVQVFPDPRLIGLLPPSAAPHVPLIPPRAGIGVDRDGE